MNKDKSFWYKLDRGDGKIQFSKHPVGFEDSFRKIYGDDSICKVKWYDSHNINDGWIYVKDKIKRIRKSKSLDKLIWIVITAVVTLLAEHWQKLLHIIKSLFSG